MIFNDYVFGPITSRRFGRSLGVNLLPTNGKWCNYNCIYCECGWNSPAAQKPLLPSVDVVISALEHRLHTLKHENALPDAITFSGNGEPTLHPHFEAIVDGVIAMRNKYAAMTKICILTNAVRCAIPSVSAALKKADIAMLKLDAGSDAALRIINNPPPQVSIAALLRAMQDFGDNLVVQTMFLCGEIDGIPVDNSTPDEVAAWLQCLRTLRPRSAAIYSLDRAAPAHSLHKISACRLHKIAQQAQALGIQAQTY
jgi:wyosine [tRNA(Phe)-imidazoG37] synthetase (radical SAM superfamily)